MQMQGMRVVGAIAEDEAIARALLQHKFLVKFWVVRILLAVDEPRVEFSVSARNLREHHVDGPIGFSRGRLSSGGLCRVTKDRVIERRARWRHPLRLLMLIRVLDDQAKTEIANVVLQRAKNPDAGLIQVDESIDAF